MKLAAEESTVIMEFVMRGIIVLSLVGTALCLVSVSHWGLGKPRLPPYVRSSLDHKHKEIRLTRELHPEYEQELKPDDLPYLHVERERRSPKKPYIHPTYRPADGRPPLIHPTYRVPSRPPPRWRF